MLKNAEVVIRKQIIFHADGYFDTVGSSIVTSQLIEKCKDVIGTFTTYEQCIAFGKYLASRMNFREKEGEYGVYVDGTALPKYVHSTRTLAQTEAQRLASKLNKTVFVVTDAYTSKTVVTVDKQF